MSLKKFCKKNALLIILLTIISIIIIIYWVDYTVKENMLQSDPKLYELKKTLKDIHPIVKDVKLYKGQKSYTINKQKIYICLFDENGEYYPINMLIYVFLHELAHLLNKEDTGHTEKFHEIFQELIYKAHSLGLYNPSIPPIENYCIHNKEEE
jgi:hypothetical protein